MVYYTGYIRDIATHLPIPYATVQDSSNPTNTVAADSQGYFEIELPSVSTLLNISSVGYSNATSRASYFDSYDTFELTRNYQSLPPVVVTPAPAPGNNTSVYIGVGIAAVIIALLASKRN